MDEARPVVARQALEGVAERMAEVEQCPVAPFVFVGRHAGGLGAAGLRDGGTAGRSAREDLTAVALEPLEEAGVVDQAVFDGFGIAGAELARRQRVEAVGVGEDEKLGWWKAPTRFLPWGALMPVLPPTEESTWARRLVGICTKRMPRFSVAAAKPARSPTTPPPSATTTSPRSSLAASTALHTAS